MSNVVQYMIRDSHGHEYGPADVALLRQWIQEKRILGHFQIGPVGTGQWQAASSHPQLADLFGAPATGAPAAPATGMGAVGQGNPASGAGTAGGANPYAARPTATQYPATGRPVQTVAAQPAQPYGGQVQPYAGQAYPAAAGAQGYAGGHAAGPQLNGMAIASLVCSLVGVLLLFACMGVLAAVPGIICGHVARGQIRRDPQKQTGEGLALAGMIVGYITVGLNLLMGLCFILTLVIGQQ